MANVSSEVLPAVLVKWLQLVKAAQIFEEVVIKDVQVPRECFAATIKSLKAEPVAAKYTFNLQPDRTGSLRITTSSCHFLIPTERSNKKVGAQSATPLWVKSKYSIPLINVYHRAEFLSRYYRKFRFKTAEKDIKTICGFSLLASFQSGLT